MARKITNYQPIYAFGDQCGYLQTIETEGFKAVEVEYFLDEEYRGQGIMSSHFPSYLQLLKDRGFTRLIAHVKKGNYVSKKLLKKNKFFKFNELDNVEIFLCVGALKPTKARIQEVKEMVYN